jgi:hypothetical protein
MLSPNKLYGTEAGVSIPVSGPAFLGRLLKAYSKAVVIKPLLV